MDLLIEDKAVIEIKSVENLVELHHKQLLTYLHGSMADMLMPSCLQ